MRAAHVLRKFNAAEWGGTETAIRQLTEGLRRNGVESTVFAPALARQKTQSRDSKIENPAGDDGIRRFRAFVPVAGISPEQRRAMVAIGGNLVSAGLFWSLLRSEGLDVVHSHALGRLGGIARAAARMKGVPFVLSIHGGAYDLPRSVQGAMESRDGFDWGRLVGLMTGARNLFDTADAVVTCNPREAEKVSERHPHTRVMVQPHGVPTGIFGADRRAAALEAFPAIVGRKVLLMPGRVDPVKNQQWVVNQASELVRRHPGVLILLVGPCTNPAYESGIRRCIADSGLSGHVLLTGGLPPGDPRLVGLLQLATAVVLPSVSETFGLVILEAWAAGTPVISSRTSGALALVEDGRNGLLFDLETPATFHAAAHRLLSDSQARFYLGEAGRRKAVAGFDTVALAARMRNLYAELLAGRPGAHRRPVPCAT